MAIDLAALPKRLLMGPGPSPVPASVLQALAAPTLGHLDGAFLGLVDELRGYLRQAFGTNNACTVPMSGTGSLGMETCVVNLLEPGDRVLIGVNGVFGTRLCEVARRAGAEVTAVTAPWGRIIEPSAYRAAAAGKKYKALFCVHAETSTGVLQPLEPLRAVCDELGALFVADTVTSLGGVEVSLDARGVDVAYSGTQKCLSCPPGLSPVTFSERAMAVVRARQRPVQSWYADLTLLNQYWGQERVYHHTAPINLLYGLHEALRLVVTEGLPARFARHRLHSEALAAGLEAMGLELPVPKSERLPPLTLVRAPDGVDEAAVRRRLLEVHGLEIGGGLGDFKGKAWRIGVMGDGARRSNVTYCLSALAQALGQAERAGDALAAAAAVYQSQGA